MIVSITRTLTCPASGKLIILLPVEEWILSYIFAPRTLAPVNTCQPHLISLPYPVWVAAKFWLFVNWHKVVAGATVITGDAGVGLTVTVKLTADPLQLPVVEVGVTLYTTLPAALLLGLINV